MRKWESFILGISIACVALFAQVFISVICEIFLHMSYVVQYDTHASLRMILPSMVIAASIEEILRMSITKGRINHYISSTTSSLITHGILLGLGFGFFELILLYMRDYNSFNVSLYVLYPFCVHVILSIFFLFVFRKYPRNIPISIIALACAILIHTIGNSIIFLMF